MKIVVNKCFGGFGLSTKAQLRYAELKGFNLYFYKQTKYKHRDGEEEYIKINPLKEECYCPYALKVDNGEVTNKLEYKHDEYFSHYDIERTDLDLIKVIEELGDKANGEHAELVVVEIPDGIEYEIDDYDGIESIHEKHRSW